mmetsp:Transcript_75338/g.191121  ORF Transcript_75338/g.191121 Transcript_75338/m.191121 type:complete len:214 (-) Transcript_75338:211-852(-)
MPLLVVLLRQERQHLVADGVLVVLAWLLRPRVLDVGQEVLPLCQRFLDVRQPTEDVFARELRSRLPAEAAILLLHGLEDRVDERLAPLQDLRMLRRHQLVVLRALGGAFDLLLQVRELEVPRLGVLLLEALVRGEAPVQLAILPLKGLDFAVQRIHIRQETEVALLQGDEDLDDFLDVGDARRGLDGGESLLEHLDVLLVLPDVPALDGVQEG